MTEEAPSCILLADRNHDVTEGVRGLLDSLFGTVVMVADGDSLLDAAARLVPDVAVVDLSLSHAGGLGWLQALKKRCPRLKVVVLSVYDEPNVRRATLDAGADAFVLKHDIAADLPPAIDLVCGGGRMDPEPGRTSPVPSIEIKESER